MNTVSNKVTNETTVQHVMPLSTTHEELLKVLHPIFERNVIMKLLKSSLSKKEFILQTAVKHYLMTQSNSLILYQEVN